MTEPHASHHTVEGLTSPQVCLLARVAASTLNYWIARGLVDPSHLGSAGRRSDRLWSVQDLVTVRAIKALREAGCPLQQVARAKEEIAKVWGSRRLGEMRLYWDGSEVLTVDPWGRLYSALKNPGQQMLHIVAMPLGQWRLEAESAAAEYDIAHRLRSREQREPRTRTPTATIHAGGRSATA